MDLKQDAAHIISAALAAAMPDAAVLRALENGHFPGPVYLVAAGKAAWQMADAAHRQLGSRIREGVVITKYGHSRGPIGPLRIFEGGHPVPDENSFRGTRAAMELVRPLTGEDTVLFLLSGGGSALFEDPLVPARELQDITRQLLACGADITGINTIRKRLSGVKGGRFAGLCAPAWVFAVVLSDVLGDPLDMIASGPVTADSSTCAQAMELARRYALELSPRARSLLEQETPKRVNNVETVITGSVRGLCTAAAAACRELGYRPVILTDRLCCEAREAGSFLASIARSHAQTGESLAFLAGGETVVRLTGRGKGGRNQELALAAAEGIRGMENVLIFSLGSDGTDGPTDAAGGMVDGTTAELLEARGLSIHEILAENDSYHGLQKAGGLIITGPTGTNVNDLAVVLLRGK